MFLLSDLHAEAMFANRRKLMEWVHLASAIALVFFSLLHLMRGCCQALVTVELLLAAAMLVTWQQIRRGASLVTVEYTLMVAAVVLFSSLVLLESMYDTGIYWVAGYPFVVYFVLTTAKARYWVAFFLIELAAIAGLDLAGWLDSPYTAEQLGCLIAAVTFYWLLAHIYKSQLELRQSQFSESCFTLAEQQKRMQVILDHSPIGIWMVDADRCIRFLNRTWVDWCGISEAEARQAPDYSELLQEPFAAKARMLDPASLTSDGPSCSREVIPCADGVTRTLDVIRVRLPATHGSASGMVGFAIDVSLQLQAQAEQQDLERQIQHGQRLESLGVMAGGIAHDFNNLLTAIQGGMELIKLEEDLSADMLESLDTMDRATRAATGLCRQMLTYAGKGLMQPEQFLLRNLIKDLDGLLHVSAGKGLSLSFHFDPDEKPIFADKGQLSQVLLNLLINASESMPVAGSGDILVAVRHGHVQEPTAGHFVGTTLQPGDYTILSVEDNGIGMDADVLERIFDPFFTTKFTGRGLGLSAIIGILNSHGAALQVESRSGEGTSMHVWFPCCDERAPDESGSEPVLPHIFAGRVLLVDDEPDVRLVAGRMLEKLELQVVAASGGQEAVEIFRRDPLFDWVLLDMTMPDMDGVACMRLLREIRPDISVVISSGYDADSMLDDGCQPADFLTKPYTMDKLRDVVRRVMKGA